MNELLRPKIIVEHRMLRGCMIMLPVFLFFEACSLCTGKLDAMLGAIIVSIVIACPVFALIFLITLGLKRLTYTLHEDKITSCWTFIWNYSVSIAYKDIKEVELDQGIFQRKFNVGSVIITTNATKERAGFEIYNIENYQEVYDFLSNKVAESKRLQDS